MNRKNILLGLILAALAFNGYRAIAFTVAQWGKPWPAPVLTIDGNNYLTGAQRLVWGESPLAMQNTYYSPGYQLYLSAFVRAWGAGQDLYAASKVGSLLFFALSLWLSFRLAKKYFSAVEAVLATLIFSASLSWVYYCNMIQYEVVAGFLLLVWASLEFREPGERSARETGIAVASGLLLAVLILFHSRFAALLSLPASRILFSRSRRSGWITLAVAVVPVFAWSAVYSLRADHIIWIMEGRSFLFRLGNNPNAVGVGFPHAPILEPSGWAFLFAYPARFLWLVGERFQYLWGIKPDVWAIPPEGMGRTGFEPTQDLLACLLFFAGLAISLRTDWRHRDRARLPFYLLVAATLLTPLLIFGHKRTLIPVIPFIAIFQARALFTVFSAALSSFPRLRRSILPR